MPAPAYSFENYFQTGEPAQDLMARIEARLSDAGWQFIEQVPITQSGTARIMRVWMCPGALNANGVDFYVGLVRNVAAAQTWFAVRLFESWNTTNKTMMRPALQGQNTGSVAWNDVHFTGSQFVAVGPAFQQSTYYNMYAGLSSDGYTWRNSRLPVNAPWCGLASGNGTLVAISGTAYPVSNGTSIGAASTIAATSTDHGVTWTQRAMPTSANWTSVTYGSGPGLFVAIAYNTGTIAASSPDGITWTARTLPTSGTWTSVTYGNGTYVAVGSGTLAGSSTNGTTWTARTMPSSAPWCAVTYGNGLFVAVSTTGLIATSPDGTTWTARTSPAGAYAGISYANGYFVATRYSNSVALGVTSSADGITWFNSPGTASIGTPYNLTNYSQGHPAFGNGVWVIPSTQIATTNVSNAMWVVTDPVTGAGTLRGLSTTSPHGQGDYPANNPAESTATLGSQVPHPQAFEPAWNFGATANYDIAVLASKSYLAVSVTNNGTGAVVAAFVAGAFAPSWSDPLDTNPALALVTNNSGATTRTMRANPDDNANQIRTALSPDGLAVGSHTNATKDPVSQSIKGVRAALAIANANYNNGFTINGAHKGWLLDAVLVPAFGSASTKTGDTVTSGGTTYTCFGTYGAGIGAGFNYGLFINTEAGS